MKRIHVFCLLSLTLCIYANGQELTVTPRMVPDFTSKEKPRAQHLGSLLLHAPVGIFAKSHLAGVGLNYALFHSRYRIYVFKKYIGFTANGGVDYYPGKKTEVAGHDFKYSGYGYGYIQAGIATAITKKAGVSLTAGPAMGIYKGNAEFGWNAGLFGTWPISNTRLLIGPGLTWKKHKETDALWTIAIRTSYRF
jgi:hypothetical protein